MTDPKPKTPRRKVALEAGRRSAAVDLVGKLGKTIEAELPPGPARDKAVRKLAAVLRAIRAAAAAAA